MNRRLPARTILAALLASVLFWGPSFAADPLRTLSRKLRKALQHDPPISVAVLTFPYAGDRTSTGSYLLSERLLTYLVQDGATVIERRLISSLLAERHLSETGLLAGAATSDAGRLVGVDALVIGTLTDVSETSTSLDVRVVHLGTSKILATGTVLEPREWGDVPRRRASGVATVVVPAVSMRAGATRTDDMIPIAGQEYPPYPNLEDERDRLHVTQTVLRLPQRYFPAPVPGFFPAAAHQIQGGVSK